MKLSIRLACGLGLVASASLGLLNGCSSDSETTPPPGAGGSAGSQTGGAGGSLAGSGGTAGSAGVSGGGGAGGSVVPPKKVEKVDLLLMIDNSASMADKQQILAQSVPDLVERLVNPPCVDSKGVPVAQQPSKPLDACPANSTREFNPIFDIHVGVITSSIGSVGADSCSDLPTSNYNPRMEDMSHLITRKESDPNQSVATYQNKGFLYWDPTQKATPPGDSDIPKFVASFSEIVTGAGQDGCGFEAPLEAWYRFLVDPAPYQKMAKVDCSTNKEDPSGSCRAPQGVDQTVIQQRADFVRPDSMVAVLMLTDEDDCSVMAGPQGYIVLQAYSGQVPWHMPRATAACATNPSSPDCKSCAQGDFSSDPECAKGAFSDNEDTLNLRCIQQKKRFGIDFLYPTQRYVDALTKATLADGRVNPLFCSKPSADGKTCTTSSRDPSQIILAGIVGVPWQDIARDPNDASKGFKPANELAWDVIVGDLDKNIAPKDPLMIQSIDARQGTNPITGEALASSSVTTPTANKSNGHEWDIVSRNDLQYACVFKLATPKDCSVETGGCDCMDFDGQHNPLCQSDTGSYGKTQYRAKAYPTPRILTVLKGLGKQAAVGSICSSNAIDQQAADFGYRPAMTALIDRMKPSF